MMVDKIKEFIDNRPEVVGAYGYGSGMFKQSGYTNKDKPQIDLIFVVDDLKKWHLENMKLNKKDYSLLGKVFFKHASEDRLKGSAGITYISSVIENGTNYKFGTIEEKDLINNLISWDSFYLPGRFQKTVYPIKENKNLKKAIAINREKALMVASYLVGLNTTTRKDIYVMLCGLSYFGDTRMKFAENPRKVLNIVEGSYDEFCKIYPLEDKDYLTVEGDVVKVNQDMIKERISKFPSGIQNYLGKNIPEDYSGVREKILEYFEKLNKKESLQQTVKGIFTSGVGRSITYASKKVMKKFKRK